MFPSILMFHPEAARAILEYRIRTLSGALENARNLGYQVRKPGHRPWGPHPKVHTQRELGRSPLPMVGTCSGLQSPHLLLLPLHQVP